MLALELIRPKPGAKFRAGDESHGVKKVPVVLDRDLFVQHSGLVVENTYPRPKLLAGHAQKMRKAALRSALTVKATENSIVILDEYLCPKQRQA
jgi:hypothetical protein